MNCVGFLLNSYNGIWLILLSYAKWASLPSFTGLFFLFFTPLTTCKWTFKVVGQKANCPRVHYSPLRLTLLATVSYILSQWFVYPAVSEQLCDLWMRWTPWTQREERWSQTAYGKLSQRARMCSSIACWLLLSCSRSGAVLFVDAAKRLIEQTNDIIMLLLIPLLRPYCQLINDVCSAAVQGGTERGGRTDRQHRRALLSGRQSINVIDCLTSFSTVFKLTSFKLQ